MSKLKQPIVFFGLALAAATLATATVWAGPMIDGSMSLESLPGTDVYPDTDDCSVWHYDIVSMKADMRQGAPKHRLATLPAASGSGHVLVSEYRWGTSADLLDQDEAAAAIAEIRRRVGDGLKQGDLNLSHCQGARITALRPTRRRVASLKLRPELAESGQGASIAVGYAAGATHEILSLEDYAHLVFTVDATHPLAEPATWQMMSQPSGAVVAMLETESAPMPRSIRVALEISRALREESQLSELARLKCKLASDDESDSRADSGKKKTAPRLSQLARLFAGETVPELACWFHEQGEDSQDMATEEAGATEAPGLPPEADLRKVQAGLRSRAWTPGISAQKLRAIHIALIERWITASFEVTQEEGVLALNRARPETSRTHRLTHQEPLATVSVSKILQLRAPSFAQVSNAELAWLNEAAPVCQKAKYTERKDKNPEVASQGLPIPMDWTLCSQK